MLKAIVSDAPRVIRVGSGASWAEMESRSSLIAAKSARARSAWCNVNQMAHPQDPAEVCLNSPVARRGCCGCGLDPHQNAAARMELHGSLKSAFSGPHWRGHSGSLSRPSLTSVVGDIKNNNRAKAQKPTSQKDCKNLPRPPCV
jgi:hypothetical protein